MDPSGMSGGGTRSEQTESADRSISLGPYEELVGRLKSIQRTTETTAVELSSGTLEYPTDSSAANICESALAGHEGQRVGILRTASVDRPLRIRVMEGEQS